MTLLLTERDTDEGLLVSVCDADILGESFENGSVSLTVENTSETGGRFLAACYWPTERIADDDESTVVEREVAAGETVGIPVSIDTEYTARESGPVTLRVDGHVTAEREVRVDV